MKARIHKEKNPVQKSLWESIAEIPGLSESQRQQLYQLERDRVAALNKRIANAFFQGAHTAMKLAREKFFVACTTGPIEQRVDAVREMFDYFLAREKGLEKDLREHGVLPEDGGESEEQDV